MDHQITGFIDLVPRCRCGRSGYPHLIVTRPDLDWSAERAVLSGTSFMVPTTEAEARALSPHPVFAVGDLAIVGSERSGAAGCWGEVTAIAWISTSTERWVQEARVRLTWPGSSTERDYRFRSCDLLEV